jgi:hypothetical protein
MAHHLVAAASLWTSWRADRRDNEAESLRH